MKTIYGRQFAMIAGVVLLSFLLLGGSFTALSYNYTLSEKRETLERNADKVAEMTAYNLTQYRDTTLNSTMIRTSLSNLAAIADASIIITTPEGTIALAVSNEGVIQSACQGRTLPITMVQGALSPYGFTGMTNFGGLYTQNRYAVGIPVVLENNFGEENLAGLVFMSAEADRLTAMWRDTSSIFMASAMVVTLLACVVASITSMKLSQPLKEIAGAAREFGHGNMEVRVDVGRRTDEIGELAEAFNVMADSLAQSEKRRTEFIANVSHELKTPMTTIAGFADGILDGTIPPERQKEYLQVISSETRRLSRLVRNMLDVSRLRAEDSGLPQAQFDICEVLVQVLVSLESKINDKNLQVFTDLPEEPVHVWGDPDAITQVCYNLLDNAIKFACQEGKLMLEIRCKGPKAYITVGDEGETIPPEELSLIFDRFHKSDRSRSLDREGVGLGLYIVKTILNSHKENITCTSEEGVTRFTFTLTRA